VVRESPQSVVFFSALFLEVLMGLEDGGFFIMNPEIKKEARRRIWGGNTEGTNLFPFTVFPFLSHSLSLSFFQ